MSLSSFVASAYGWMLSFFDLLASIHPFTDFPSISLLEIMAGVCLLTLCLIFVPGFDEDDMDDEELNDTSIDENWDD